MKRFSKISLVVIAATLILSACAFNRNALIGSWKEESSEVVLQFSVNGMLSQSSPQAPGSSVEIGYQFLDDTTIHIIGTQSVYAFKVEGDTLTLTDTTQSQSITLTRVR